jgi:ribosomal protein S18 acetylase RimI-like enzyme
MSLRLKIPDKEDYDILKSLDDIVFYDTPYVQIAYFNGCFVGFCAVELRKDHFYLTKLSVEAAYRRNGVGSRLLSALKKRLRPSRSRIEVVVDEKDLEVQLFLSKNGFFCYSSNENYAPSYRFAYYL